MQENVSHALEKAFANDKLYRTIDPKFLKDFERLLHEVLINYQKRNLTLLDFLDFYESYKDNILSSNNIQFNRISALKILIIIRVPNSFNLNLLPKYMQFKYGFISPLPSYSVLGISSCKDNTVPDG